MIDQRREFVGFARLPNANISELCRRFGISRKTGYKWLGRDDCEDHSRRPLLTPALTPERVQEQILKARDSYGWGGRKISWILQRDQQIAVAPSTVNSVLKRHGRISQDASARATPWQRFEHEEPNSLWQIDFKGHFPTGQQRCHPLTVIDDHSRFNVVLQALGDERRASVQPVLERAFKRFGLPVRINADNGNPWGNPGHPGALTGLAVWLIRLGVRVSHSRPFHPQTNGKDERFHRSMKDEVLSRYTLNSLQEAQNRLSGWRHIYNFKRPHESLGMQTPASRYRPSSKRMPDKLPPIEYLEDDLVRRVQLNGWINLKGREFRLSKALVGQQVACRATPEDGEFAIFFCHQKVDQISLKEP